MTPPATVASRRDDVESDRRAKIDDNGRRAVERHRGSGVGQSIRRQLFPALE